MSRAPASDHNPYAGVRSDCLPIDLPKNVARKSLNCLPCGEAGPREHLASGAVADASADAASRLPNPRSGKSRSTLLTGTADFPTVTGNGVPMASGNRTMRNGFIAGIAVLVASLAGCASMCDSSLDCDFHAFGGMRDRQDRVHGRVASLFDPAAALASTVPPMEGLPRFGDDGLDSPETGDGSVDDSGLTDELLNELDKYDELPEVPGVNGSNSPTPAPGLPDSLLDI